MSAFLAWLATTKLGRWALALFALLVAFGATALAMFEKGQRKQAVADKAKDAQSLAEAAQQAVQAANTRNEVQRETDALPDAPAQTVATADPATAAGKLRDDGWLRDAGPHDH
jgi:hypothetical protein